MYQLCFFFHTLGNGQIQANMLNDNELLEKFLLKLRKILPNFISSFKTFVVTVTDFHCSLNSEELFQITYVDELK